MKKEILFTITSLILISSFFISCSNNTDKNIILTDEEADHITNFLTDFMVFSEGNKLDIEDMGFPKQFYLYDKDVVLSLGDMLFLFFQKQNPTIKQDYFIFQNQDFEFVEQASDVKEAYELALTGKIPKKISEKELHNFVYQTLVDDTSFDYEVNDLNTESRGINIAFTFDIESGRYISESSETAISPCKDSNYSLGLDKDEIICNEPEYVAWMSPRDVNVAYTEYPYPHVSGIMGFMEILDYPERYGIPTTNFIVKKDIVAFDVLDKKLVDRAKSLVKKGLFEVGSHTRYHTHLNLVDEELAKKELKESKLFLEEFFDTIVFGFRAPYLSILTDERTYVDAIEQAGYVYYSHVGGFGNLVGSPIVHKPWNTAKYVAYMTPTEFKEMMKEKEYIVTLDHTWNMVYQDGDILVEDPKIPDNYRAIVLTAISNGGIPVMLKDLNKT